MTKLKALLEYLLDNIFDIATIIVAGYIVIRQQLPATASADIADLATWILAVLSLIAVSGLWERNRRLNRIENIAQEGRDLIKRRLSGKVLSSDFFLKDCGVSIQTFASADTIYVSGMTLARTTREYQDIWEKRLRAGDTIRIIILDTKNQNIMKELALRSAGGLPPQYWQNRIKTVEELVKIIANTPGSTGKLELGHLPYIPSFGIIMTDPYKQNGIGFIELYHHESSVATPTFELSLSRDQEWFVFFRDQFEIMWKSCRVDIIDKSFTK